MAFDAKTFLESGGTTAGLGASFGVPSCMINLASDALGIIPSDILRSMRSSMSQGAALGDAAVKKVNSFIRDTLGISLFPDRDGFFGFFSDTSRFGLDTLGGITSTIGTFIGVAQAAQSAVTELTNRYNAAADCLSSYKSYLDFSSGNAGDRREEQAALNPAGYSDAINSQFGIYFEQSQTAQRIVDDLNAQISVIDNILLQRDLDPSLEPGQEELQAFESVFRLEAGPPKSTVGRFLLSVDGLYYDSVTSGITPALLELEQRGEDLALETGGFRNPNLWSLEYDPSLGGRGVPTTVKDLEFYFDTILDPNILDNSKELEKFYEQDELMLSLEGQKDRKVFDVSEELQNLIDNGESQAVVDNLRQVMLSETSHFQDKINKRKKQIELAVKVPAFLGKGPQYGYGEIPVNDFSYLAGSNFLLDLENQRKITLDQADVEGVVLPLEVKYTEKVETNDPLLLNHILVNNIALGETISDAEATSGASLHLQDRVIEDNLFALYNYLTVEDSDPSSAKYALHNSSRFGVDYNAQLVGEISSTFGKGLGIPFLRGVAIPEQGNLSSIDFMGTFAKAPERNEFKDFMYNTGGATFETWIHIPEIDSLSQWDIHDGDTLGLYRLILANENVGISDSKEPQPNINNLSQDNGTGITRGLIYGFTRDRRFTQGLEPSNNPSLNNIENLVLVLAPTQSFDSSSAGFIANRGVDCNKDSLRGMTIPVWEAFEGKSLSSCATSFCQLTLCLDPRNDEVNVYLDGSLLATSGYREVFGTSSKGETYKAPSIKQNNSFSYPDGPLLDTYFTPWIIGGGYTDGLSSGNFMGGEYGGTISGLRGYLGCTKFYSKPLNNSEVINNYNSNSEFFKNIYMPNLLWEPLEIE